MSQSTTMVMSRLINKFKRFLGGRLLRNELVVQLETINAKQQ